MGLTDLIEDNPVEIIDVSKTKYSKVNVLGTEYKIPSRVYSAEMLIGISPPKEHSFLTGGIEEGQLGNLKGYTGVKKNLAVGLLPKDQKRLAHGVSNEIYAK